MIRPSRLRSVERLTEIADRLAGVGGVVGVCLGGSRARGTHDPDSDFDLGLYYRPPLDTAALRLLAAELTGGPVEVTEPGGWGPWVDGGAWLTIDGHRVDWIYRDLDRVHRVWQQCRAGRFEIGTQPGHPLGVYSHSYAGEVALGRVLADPGGELRTLREQTRHYPEPLREALIDNARWEAPFILAGARKGAARGDAFFVAGCLFRAVGLLVHALHAHARCWVLNEKGAVRAAGQLAVAPHNFAERAHNLFSALGTTPRTLTTTLDTADRLTTETCERLTE
ncbi:nucleotidyltransferase domain-containing protein [Streptomyces lavenduligriseus]|uniref:Nucleotidyltransferase domain-containing protein n=1 Tax=Streptomyces lavenduligriseus TaxID=67315 RepID=A0ABT0NSD0_9ACTN|nr:nucleotidyltransferase domain-containing protein [Streptomyces lavenduligriseus]MCL3994369.1 nucleotidyltransferase domain-containing protein [Streptomyces lavenduligriseus]